MKIRSLQYAVTVTNTETKVIVKLVQNLLIYTSPAAITAVDANRDQ
jgi:hypothetical protein